MPLPSPELLRHPGAFAWWYLDLVDDAGDGLVLIWFFGLPFLPGAAARAGEGARAPLDRPGLNVVVYKGGRDAFYLLHEADPAACSWDPERLRWRFEDSVIHLARGATGWSLDARIDAAWGAPGERVQARIALAGKPVHGVQEGEVGGLHTRSPLATACRARATVRVGDRDLQLSGRAYLDRNDALVPLPDQGMARWRWGRLALPGRELIWYDVEAEGAAAPRQVLLLEVDPDGAARLLPEPGLRWEGPRRSFYGPRWHERLLVGREPRVAIHFRHVVDDGPFYQRYLVEGVDSAGGRGWGVAEQVLPARTDRSWQRPFVRMRVHRTVGENSTWLPLFSGPRAGRVARLLGAWRGRAGAAETAGEVGVLAPAGERRTK